MSLTLTILGCGSSGGVPRIGNDWGACDPDNPKNRRRRCALLVQMGQDHQTTTVLIDTGPDLREQLLDAKVSRLDAVLYTHSHADHLHGIDDLRAFMVRDGRRMPVYMDEITFHRARTAFSYCFETPVGSNYPPILDPQPIEIGHAVHIPGAGGDLFFEPIRMEHGEIDALGFRIGNAAYIPDVSHIPDESLPMLKDLDALILDCLRRRRHPSHFNLDDALAWTQKISPRRAIFTNMHNDLDYQTLCAELPADIEPAYDGMTIDVAVGGTQTTASTIAHAG